VSLGRHVPEWAALRAALDALVGTTGAVRAAVVDEGNFLWCWSDPKDDEDILVYMNAFHEREIASLRPPLHRGGHVRLALRDPFWRSGRSYVAESFAAIYVLVVWFDGAQDLSLRAAQIHAALPRIEALTLAIPPPDGPATTRGASKLRA
jgi:hypothetical protein